MLPWENLSLTQVPPAPEWTPTTLLNVIYEHMAAISQKNSFQFKLNLQNLKQDQSHLETTRKTGNTGCSCTRFFKPKRWGRLLWSAARLGPAPCTAGTPSQHPANSGQLLVHSEKTMQNNFTSAPWHNQLDAQLITLVNMIFVSRVPIVKYGRGTERHLPKTDESVIRPAGKHR